MFDDPADEWLEWRRLAPAERMRESQKLWAQYLAMGGSLDPDPDPTSPFDFPELRGPCPSDGRPSLHFVRRSAV